MSHDPNDWSPSPHKSYEIRRTNGSETDVAGEEFVLAVNALTAKAKALVEAVGSDDTGKLIGGQWVAGNGGLLSRATIAAADALRLELAKWR